MPERRRVSRRIAGIVGLAVMLTATTVGVTLRYFESDRRGSRSSTSDRAPIDERSPLADLNEALRAGDSRASF